ncbi:hypothetical protein ACFL9U_10450, partial [Thermodesulfobacteriota bacterium]
MDHIVPGTGVYHGVLHLVGLIKYVGLPEALFGVVRALLIHKTQLGRHRRISLGHSSVLRVD